MRIGTGVFVSQFIAAVLFLGGCPRTPAPSKERSKPQDFQDADAAVDFYLKATKTDPHNTNYRLKLNQARFDAAQQHIQKGIRKRERGELQAAISEFQRAQVLDPSCTLADQELKQTEDMLAEQLSSAQAQTSSVDGPQTVYASHPPELKPLSRAPVNLRMTNDAKVVFDTLGKLAGITVVYDPELQARRISTELNNVTLEQALDVVCLEAKAFWKPLTENIIMIFRIRPRSGATTKSRKCAPFI